MVFRRLCPIAFNSHRRARGLFARQVKWKPPGSMRAMDYLSYRHGFDMKISQAHAVIDFDRNTFPPVALSRKRDAMKRFSAVPKVGKRSLQNRNRPAHVAVARRAGTSISLDQFGMVPDVGKIGETGRLVLIRCFQPASLPSLKVAT